jgi:uncharacterized protein (DUF2384 family)
MSETKVREPLVFLPLELMSRLRLFGMRTAYDEVMATGIKRRFQTFRRTENEPSGSTQGGRSWRVADQSDKATATRLTNN